MAEGGVEELRLTPYSHYLRFIHNNHNLRFILNNHSLRFKWRRGRGSQKGVGGAEVPGLAGPHRDTTYV